VANVLSLALKVTGDASRLNLTPVERALNRLQAETDKVGKTFAKFATDSEAGARAQQQFATQSAALNDALKSGQVSAQQYAEQFARLAEAANKEAAALERAARITEANISPQQRFSRAVSELREQLNSGRISQETFNRAMERAQTDLRGASGAAKTAEVSLRGVASQVRVIATLQIGSALISGFRTITRAASSFAQQIRGIVGGVTQSLDAIDKLSIRTGISTQALQGYGVAAKLAGVGIEQFSTAVTKLGVAIGKADEGGAFDKTLQSIGLSLQNLRALAPEQQFTTIAEAIRGLPTDAERAAAAVEVFGRQGAALIPLFKEGADNIDELLKRAERLGIVVGQTQIDNITKMNDTFQLVQSTIEGIIGQVSGNLAPLVTAIAEEFLQFVETFEGSGGQGGTGIANAITDTLLDGAEILASVFDQFVSNFGGFASTIEAASSGFSSFGRVLTFVTESLRAGFNAFELAGNVLAEGLGFFLEGIGKWVSRDLRDAGRDLRLAAADARRANTQELAESASNAADALVDVFSGAGDKAREAGNGAGEQFVRSLREKIENERLPEVQFQTNVDKVRDQFDSFFGGLIDESSAAAGLMREFEQAVSEAQQDAEITAEEVARIARLQEQINTTINAELAARREVTAAAGKQAEADSKRIDALLGTSEAASRASEDIAALEREIQRVQSEINAAGAGESPALQARLSQLEDLQQAIGQGFEQGFDKAFESTAKGFDSVIAKASEFGQAGIEAAAKLQQGIAAAQQQARDGILNREAYEQEVARQQELFDKQLADIKTLADERQKINQFVDQQIELARFGGDSRRLEASKNVAALEAEIARVTAEINAARDAGNQQAVKAGIERLGQLDQVAAKERDIANGKAQEREQQRKFFEEQAKAAQQQQQKEQQRQQQIQQAQRQAQEEQARAAAVEAERQQKRIRALNSIGQQSVSGGDLRTSQGASQFIQAAAGAFDPNLAQQRAQTKLLQKIATNSGALQFLERGIGQAVQILGAR
jgi:hypothetical protein